MSSPIGHSLVGCLIHIAGSGKKRPRPHSKIGILKSLKPTHLGTLLIFVVIANAPDLDFIPGLLMNEPNRYHHGISHSFGAAVLVSGMIAWLHKLPVFQKVHVSFGSALTLYSSHLVLDMLTLDARLPLGIPLFWPLSGTYLHVPVLPPVKHSFLDDATIAQFLTDAFSTHNLGVVLMECLLAFSFLLVIILLKKYVLLIRSQLVE